MSTIVYRDGVMAADTRAWAGSRMPIGNKMKIHRLFDGSLLGISSSAVGLGEALRDWFNAGTPCGSHPTPLEFQALLVKPDGQVFYYSDSVNPTGPLVAPYWAIGSGEHFALGAMALGADAVRAIEVACELDTVSGLPVAALKLEDPSKPSAAKTG